ncbi:Protein of unknown function [Saccharopolyspora antimicrobica]|uniref:Uncharacterized protein DUF861 n=1 Tax=Saccharopolyspora antimicrobica TaxID=455193 RepID=A0A1I4U186_9PSEU|nr:cupin domain-containing protein [Saccharopolyspora antimicrobica]RKT88630.1 uncharacterized protein DUF861 [Saccharopolyspora antimicrobica]SFM82675.1 Protein of unknown function [Saccharopolyspora antimicrobica]
MRTQVVKIEDARRRADWDPVGDGRFAGSDLIDATAQPDARMTVGFGSIAAGESLRASFPYDEVMVVIKGVVTIQDENGEIFTATTGNVVYMPAGSTNTCTFDDDVEIAYIANPPAVYAEHATQQLGR